MSSQIERGTAREMVHTIAFRAGVLERILQEPVYGSLEVRSDELAHVQLLQRQIDDLRRYLNLPSAEPERRWIPVNEALPEPWQEVLTTYEYKGKRFVQTAEYAGQNNEKGHPLFCAYSDEFAPDHYDFVYVAWMPLPEAWRGE